MIVEIVMTKTFWLAAFFVLLFLDCIMCVIVGVLGIEKNKNYSLATAADGILLGTICLGWLVSP